MLSLRPQAAQAQNFRHHQNIDMRQDMQQCLSTPEYNFSYSELGRPVLRPKSVPTIRRKKVIFHYRRGYCRGVFQDMQAMPVDFFKGSQNIEVIVTDTTSTLVEQAVSHCREEF